MTAELTRLQNPFLRNNPFYKPQKFHSEPKVNIPHQYE